MLTQSEWWNVMNHKDWQTKYATVEREARELLGALPDGVTLSTAHLVHRLYDGGRNDVSENIFDALKALASHGLRDAWKPDGAGRTVQRKLWFKPPVKACPHCGGHL